MRCSITWVTVASSVAADAPGYVAMTLTPSGAIDGYCETGNFKIDSTPASITTIAITHAKIGRSMKNFAIVHCPARGAGAADIGANGEPLPEPEPGAGAAGGGTAAGGGAAGGVAA